MVRLKSVLDVMWIVGGRMGCVEIGWLDGVVWSVVVGEKCGEWLNESEHGVWMGGLGCGYLVTG